MDLVLRTVVVFLLILVVTRAVGRRELSSMEPFDLILLVVIGDLVQQGVTQSDYSVTGAFLVISTLCLLTVLFSYLRFRLLWLLPVLSSFRSSRFPRRRPTLEGEPLVLIEDGEIIQTNLRRERLAVEE